jgi:hypothetical protein
MMKRTIACAVTLAGLVLGVFVFGSASASLKTATPRRSSSAIMRGAARPAGGFTKEREEELEQENVEDEEIVKREAALESAAVEQEEQEELASIEKEQEGRPPGEELPPTIERVELNIKHAIFSRFRVWAFPHGTRTHVVAIADWAEKCNTVAKECKRKGHYHHSRFVLGTLTNFKKKKGEKLATPLFNRQGCQVTEYWIIATNRWGQTQSTGWAGRCISGQGE